MAGAVAIVHNRRPQTASQLDPLSARSPRGRVVIVLIVALATVGGVDPAPEAAVRPASRREPTRRAG